MSYGICHLSYIPGRAEAKDASEQVTQVVFGEHYEVLEEQEKWVKIKTALDHYNCWIDKKQFVEINWETFEELNRNEFQMVTNTQTYALTNEDVKLALPIGAILPYLHNNVVKIGKQTYRIFNHSQKPLIWQNILKEFGLVTYQWGGRTAFGIDCSGFSQMVYRTHGIFLPRDAYQQEEDEKAYSVLFEEQQEGDLAFFVNDKGKTTHVGIILADYFIIHASGYLRIDKLTTKGIMDSNGNYTHTLKNIKRYEHS